MRAKVKILKLRACILNLTESRPTWIASWGCKRTRLARSIKHSSISIQSPFSHRQFNLDSVLRSNNTYLNLPEVDLRCGSSFLGMIEGSFEHPQMSSISIIDLLFFILVERGISGDANRHHDQHGSQPRAFHRQGRTSVCLNPRSTGNLVMFSLFVSLECFARCPRPPSIDPRSTRNQNGRSRDLFIDHRRWSVWSRWLVEENEGTRKTATRPISLRSVRVRYL